MAITEGLLENIKSIASSAGVEGLEDKEDLYAFLSPVMQSPDLEAVTRATDVRDDLLETAVRHEGNLKSLETDYRPDAYGTSEAPFKLSQEYVTWLNEREKNKMLDAGEDLVQDRLKFDDFNQKLDKIEELYPNSPMNVVTEPLRILINDYKERLDSFVGEVVEDKFSPEANVIREYMAGDEAFQSRKQASQAGAEGMEEILQGLINTKYEKQKENENKY